MLTFVNFSASWCCESFFAGGDGMERGTERLDRFLIKFCCLRMFNIAADIHDAIGWSRCGTRWWIPLLTRRVNICEIDMNGVENCIKVPQEEEKIEITSDRVLTIASGCRCCRPGMHRVVPSWMCARLPRCPCHQPSWGIHRRETTACTSLGEGNQFIDRRHRFAILTWRLSLCDSWRNKRPLMVNAATLPSS